VAKRVRGLMMQADRRPGRLAGAWQENDERGVDGGWRTFLFRTLKRAANRVGQLFRRERLVQETAAALEDPTLGQ
jgi:hypothetical protein